MAKNRNNKKTGVLLLGLIVFSTLIAATLLVGFESNGAFSSSSSLNAESSPESSFVKDDFTAILNTEENGLGTISATNMSFDEKGFDFIEVYGLLYDDLYYKALNISFKGIQYKRTVLPAVVDNINSNITDRNYITVELNETLSVQYNMSKYIIDGQVEGYMIYEPRLYPTLLKEVYLENSSIPIKKLSSSDYSVDEYNFMVFDYFKFFNQSHFNNFTLHLIWDYNLTISGWSLTQSTDEEFLIEEEQQTVTPKFKYGFTISGETYNYNRSEIIKATSLNVELSVSPPDKNLLKNHNLKVNGVQISPAQLSNYLLTDKTIKINVNGNNSNLHLEFNADFTVTFFEPVDTTWAIDRLVEHKNIRERIYIPSITAGPEQIYVKYLNIVENTIFIEQILGNSSQFGRNVNYFQIILGEFQSFDELQNSLVFTENSTRSSGLKVFLPYLIKGEACPFVLRYKTAYNLRILITDSINSPLIDAEAELYYYDALYGTYISNENTQPIPIATTDDKGEILINDVPNGNYTLKVYQNDQLVMETTVTTYTEINYVVTSVIHFPIWIVLFASVSLALFVLGFIFYNHSKKKRM